MTLWMARIAPLDVESSDGRILDAAGKWTLRPGAHLVTLRPERRTIGVVESLHVRDGFLWATGTVGYLGYAIRMHNGDLRPAMEFGEHVTELLDGGPRLLVRSAEVVALAVAEAPAWDTVRFDVAVWPGDVGDPTT